MATILKPARNFWCERPVHSVGLLVDGDDYYRAVYDAAQHARHYILLAGWQFDSDASLLRGTEAENASMPVELLKFLDALCARTPTLHVYLLAWDFHAVFAVEREWMQDIRFNWTTNERLTFLFDSHHPDRASHHQKFVVIDGQLSFLGGLDLCDHRWDDRVHKDPNPLRLSRGEPHKPFHDVQAFVVGPDISQKMAELFVHRWAAAGGAPIELPDVATRDVTQCSLRNAVSLAASRVALSRTDPYGSPTETANCEEVCALYEDAIDAAERLIYVETQYFTSIKVAAALMRRLRKEGAPPLDIVLVLNMNADTIKEEIAVGLAQAKVIGELREAAQGTPHRLGIYYTVPETSGGVEPPRATYIHAKLMIVDDRFLTVGSANLTNRSMGLDTELNVSVEAANPTDPLARSIAAARQSLISEHLGLPHAEAERSHGLVARLDELARKREGRLRLHPSPTEKELTALSVVDPQQLPFDPAAMESHDNDRSIFVGGLGVLWARLSGASSDH